MSSERRGPEVGQPQSGRNALVIEMLECPGDLRIPVAKLDMPDTLNALDHQTVLGLTERLAEWARDPQVAAVVLGTTGERAFCAGGDIRSIYDMIVAKNWRGADAFFVDEYRLNRLLHKYPKPTVCWGTGIVMGGGMGLMQGCSFRVATDTTRIAMPETLIGFFPDVGACHFLRKAPEGTGLFLGLAGPHLNARDAVAAKLADIMAPSVSLDKVLAGMQACSYSGNAQEDKALITKTLRAGHPAGLAQESQYEQAIDDIASCIRKDDLAGTLARLAESRNEWVAKAAGRMSGSSPAALSTWWRYWQRGDGLDIDDILRCDHRLVAAYIRNGEFREGVRALIIDKDRSPQWRHRTVEEVDNVWLQRMEETESTTELAFIEL